MTASGGSSYVLSVAFELILFICTMNSTAFVFLSWCALAGLSINFVGIDPSEVLIPSLLLCGILHAHLNIKNLRLGKSETALAALFLMLYTFSNVINVFNLSYIVHVGIGACLFVFFKLFIVSESRMRQALISIFAGLLLTSIASAFALLNMWRPGDLFFPVMSADRYQALMGDPNILAILTVIVAIWLMDEIFAPKLLKRYRPLVAVCLVATIIQIALTLSRSGWLNLAVSISCYIFLDLLKRRLARATTIALTILALTVSAICLLLYAGDENSLSDRINSLTAHSSQAEADRFDLLYTRNAIDLAQSRPWGVGSGMAAPNLDQRSAEGLPIASHNAFVQILTENGWGAFIVVLIACMTTLFSLVQKAMRHNESRFGLSYQFLISVAMGLIANSMFQDLIEWQIAWILPALATIVLWPPRSSESLTT